MLVGYSVRQPDGRTYKMLEEPKENRLPQVESLLDKWSDYCNRNWLSSDCDDPYCPENKVKSFLGSLAYFLLQGDTDGVVTNYKEVANGKREIPMSSCPSYIEDKLYSAASVPGMQQRREERETFMAMLRSGADLPKKKNPAPQKESRFKKISRLRETYGIREFTRHVVDTDGCFTIDGAQYQINLGKYPQYAAAGETEDEAVYGMDCVICGHDREGCLWLFDMEYEEIFPEMKNKA